MSNKGSVHKVTYGHYMRKPAFAEGIWDYILGEWAEKYEKWDTDAQWAYERGRQFSALYRGDVYKRKVPTPAAIAAYSAARRAKIIV